jgi:hypothetical protein
MFGYVPPFTQTIINNGECSVEKINPRPNVLGQIQDYKLVKYVKDFKFHSTTFTKKW